MTVKESFEKFIEYHKNKGNKQTTIETYQFQCLPFIRFIGEATEIETISLDAVYSYMKYLNSLVLSKGSISSYIRSMRIYIRYLNEKIKLPIEYKEITIPRMPPRDCPMYTSEQIKQILNACGSNDNWIHVRNKLSIILMLDSGLRQTEVTRLHLNDFDFINNRIKVFGKGDKTRYVPLGNFSKIYLGKYLEICPYDTNEYLMCSDDGSVLSGNALRVMSNRLKKKLGFPFSCHLLRHNFATNYLLDKYNKDHFLDVAGLKTIMGHVSSTTTNGYVHIVQSYIACRDAPSHLDSIMYDAI